MNVSLILYYNKYYYRQYRGSYGNRERLFLFKDKFIIGIVAVPQRKVRAPNIIVKVKGDSVLYILKSIIEL